MRPSFGSKVQQNLARVKAMILTPAAWVASLVRPLTYSLFRRLPEGHLPPIHSDPSREADSSISRVEQRENDWDRDRVWQLVQSSRSRFVLFCQPGCVEQFDDFLPLFRDSRTFAVARQTGFREWRPVMLPLSPFRPLAPGEATRVAAPLGGAVLVDREKLVCLGVPDALIAGEGWLNLFWRAAAAGWHSYSLGARNPPPQQPDYCLEEMLFVKDLCLDRRLRPRLPPALALDRGNIAFRPDLVRPYRQLPRILVVAPCVPFPPAHGGAVRVYNLCKALADHFDLIAICFREVNESVDYAQLHTIFRRVYIVDRDEVHCDPAMPELVNRAESPSMRSLIATIARDECADLLQIEWTEMARYRDAVPQLPVILVEHDVTYIRYRQLADWDGRHVFRQEYERWYRFEAERLRTFDAVFVMSQQDKEDAVRAGSPRRRTHVVPNGVDLEHFAALPASNGCEILFVGTFGHLPNLLAFDELRTRIMPRVWEIYPQAVLRVIAGPDHERHWQDAVLRGVRLEARPGLDSRIVMHDFVPDLRPFYQSAQIVVVPLVLGAGTCIKVMEALACQRAVVSSPVGVRGLDLENGFDAVICPLEDFAGEICRLLEDHTLRDSIARRGRSTAEARFGWKRIAEEVVDIYSPLVRESRVQRSLAGDGRLEEQDQAAAIERTSIPREAVLRCLHLALKMTDSIGSRLSAVRQPAAAGPFEPGISVVIPERANPGLLARCLASVDIACRELGEPSEVIVVVNGSPQSLYRELMCRYNRVCWFFSESPLWFGGAVRRGLAAAQYDWVYLLNNDMTVDPQAFRSLLPWRAPNVFGVSSQIFFDDPTKNREETGWTVCRERHGMIEILDGIPGDDSTVRGVFYPGGGASLFRREVLLPLTGQTSVYAPFYWEDVEWGACAWRLGYESLYCPESKVWHGHRQTNRKLFSESEVNRILRRNGFVFHLRNGSVPGSFDPFRRLMAMLDEDSLREILAPRRMFEIAAGRLHNRARRFLDPPLIRTWQRTYGSAEKMAS